VKRYFFHIAYNGINYRGWQRQPKSINIQQVVDTALCQILKKNITIIGCGRTDAKVHASQFFFHIDIAQEWDYDLLFRLNKILPDDIAAYDIIPVADLAHSRYDATLRTYDYFIHTCKNPFLSDFSAMYLEKNLNFDKMQQAASLLVRYNDYKCFCKSPANFRTTICNIRSSALFTDPSESRIRFQISASRFLTSMIRIIVTKLLEIGRGELSVDEFEGYLIRGETPTLIKPAHPQGLYLSKVTYPYLDIAPKGELSSILQNLQQNWIAV